MNQLYPIYEYRKHRYVLATFVAMPLLILLYLQSLDFDGRVWAKICLYIYWGFFVSIGIQWISWYFFVKKRCAINDGIFALIPTVVFLLLTPFAYGSGKRVLFAGSFCLSTSGMIALIILWSSYWRVEKLWINSPRSKELKNYSKKRNMFYQRYMHKLFPKILASLKLPAWISQHTSKLPIFSHYVSNLHVLGKKIYFSFQETSSLFIFDVETTEDHYYTFSVVKMPLSFPDLDIFSIPNTSSSVLQLPEIFFESYQFNQKFKIYSHNLLFAHQLISSKMMVFLLEQKIHLNLQMRENILLLSHVTKDTWTTGKIDSVHKFLEEFYRELPNFLKEDYKK